MIQTFDGKTEELRDGLHGDYPVEMGSLYVYDGGRARVVFLRGGPRDWYVWSEKRQCRLATYGTRAQLLVAWERSNNTDGPYGCSALSLD